MTARDEQHLSLLRARVGDSLTRLRLNFVAERIDALLADAAKSDKTFLEFLDALLADELASKQRKRVTMGIAIAHFPAVKTIDDFDFKFQPSVDQKLVRELATGGFVSNAENVVFFGPPGVGKTHLAIAIGRAAVEAGHTLRRSRPASRCLIAIGRAAVEAGHTVLFTSATALLGALSKAETEGQLDVRLAFYAKPKLLVVDELGYLPFERRSAHLFFQLVARRYLKGSTMITTNQLVAQWGSVFGDDVLAAAILDRLLHHSYTMVIQGESYRLKQKKRRGWSTARGCIQLAELGPLTKAGSEQAR
jgi:DNA replication protein DnaC